MHDERAWLFFFISKIQDTMVPSRMERSALYA